jgi:putative transposase
LLALEDGQVTFAWKDYRDGQQKHMTVSAGEFIRRFLVHSLPQGFQRIRYYGFLANCHRAAKLEVCRYCLAVPASDWLPRPANYRDFYLALTGRDPRRCPQCGTGILIRIGLWVRRIRRRSFFPILTTTWAMISPSFTSETFPSSWSRADIVMTLRMPWMGTRERQK